MNNSFFIGALGAHQQQKNMNVIGNNVANVNTHGYKALKGRFAALMYDDLYTAEGDMALKGTGTHVNGTDTIFAPGGGASTGRKTDYMIEGEGFFALKDLRTGEVSLTRNGAFTMASREEEIQDAFGNPVREMVYYLSDGEGRFVMDQQGQMIRVTDPNATQPVGIFDCENYNGILHAGDTRYITVPKNGALRAGEGKLVQGYLETSNVDLAQEMVQLIEAQRAYSLGLKVMLTSDEIETTINNLRG